MTGRPRTISAQVREAIAQAGVDGLTPEELRERIPGMGHRQGKHSVDRLVEAGEIFRIGNYRRTKFFAPSVTMEEAKASMVRFMAQVAVQAKKLEAAAQRRRLLKERQRRAERAAALAGERSAKAAEKARAAAERERLRQEARNAKARAKTAAKRHREANGLADRIRGTGTKASAHRGPVVVTKHPEFRLTVCPRPQDRFAVDPCHLSGLSKLPFGTYAEPASTWAATLTEKVAA